MQLNLHENIKKYRKEMGLTQEALAEAFGVTVGAVSKWESGNTVPDIVTLMELADFSAFPWMFFLDMICPPRGLRTLKKE